MRPGRGEFPPHVMLTTKREEFRLSERILDAKCKGGRCRATVHGRGLEADEAALLVFQVQPSGHLPW